MPADIAAGIGNVNHIMIAATVPNRAAIFIVKRFMQKKDLGNLEAERTQLTPQLLESMWPKPAGDDGTKLIFG